MEITPEKMLALLTLYLLFVSAAVSQNFGIPLISEETAKQYLVNNEAKRKCPDPVYEYSFCEINTAMCAYANEDVREQKCASTSPCDVGYRCEFSNPCPAHGYTLTCSPDPCMSHPCENGGTCKGYYNQIICACRPGYETDDCKLDCRPGPADVLFLLDTSYSQSDTLNQSLEFIQQFVSKVPVGNKDFQFGLITYSTVATLVFDFNDHENKQDLLSAIRHLTSEEGPTFTRKALLKANEVIEDRNSGVRVTGTKKYIILITDGLSTDRTAAVSTAVQLTRKGFQITTIGVGTAVDRTELLQLASDRSAVFSPDNNDAFNRLMLETSGRHCNVCYETSRSDIFVALDTSSAHQTELQYQETLNSMSAFVDALDIEHFDIHIGVASFAESVKPIIDLAEMSNTDRIQSHIQNIPRSLNSNTNISSVIWYIHESVFPNGKGGRPNARKIVVIFCTGYWDDNENEIKMEINTLKESGISVILIGTGTHTDINAMVEVAGTSFDVIDLADVNVRKPLIDSVVQQAKNLICKHDLFSST